jgi:multicomponent Na+:H+ antiporter subunit G
MSPGEWLTLILTLIGAFFFVAGTVGLLRFPDVYTRLHALTKADNLGLSCVVVGLALQTWSWLVVVKLLLIWVLVLTASAVACHEVARTAVQLGVRPWKK